ncbi:MAG: hypothetical protein VKJ64_19730 [Leptolyngbyaceae bacterium]|nr:hypothetical protein [Leptolyngbyaceae bacterium]
MKSIINMGLSLAFLIAAGWIVKDVILKADANPIGGEEANIEDRQGEIDTLRQSK